MKAIFKGNKFAIQWTIKNAVTSLPFDFTGMFVEYILYSDSYKGRIVGATTNINKMQAEIPANILPVGVYNIICKYRNSINEGRCIYRNAFQITRNPEYIGCDNIVVIESFAAPLKLENMDVNYIGHFPSEESLTNCNRPSWALVGNLKEAAPYFFYMPNSVPPGYQSGWNNLSAILGTYNLTEDKVSIYDFNLITEYNVSRNHTHTERKFSPHWGATTKYYPEYEEYSPCKVYEKNERVNMPGYTENSFIALHQTSDAPYEIVNETSEFSFSEAINLVPEEFRFPGIRMTYVKKDTHQAETWFYKGGLWENKKNWVKPEGNVTINNSPDEEDISSIGDNAPVLKLKDKVYNPQTFSGLGRTYLRKNMINGKNVLTQDMFTNDDGSVRSNTRYIIQYDYDLKGATINLPDNCVLDFQGGSLSNGSMKGTGIRTINKNSGSAVFVNGVNINYDNEWVKASEIGMIANDESSASVNDGILDVVVSSGKYLELDGTYYFSESHNISGILKIRNGKLIYTKSDFLIPQENADLSFDNVNITGKDYFIRKTSLNYVVKSVIFDNCTIESIRVCYFSGADVLYENNPYGLERFRVSNCKFYNMNRTAMVLKDVVISKECSFTGNYVDSFQYTLLYFGKTNEYSNITDNEIYGCDVVFKGNVIKGDVCNNDSYYTPLLLDGVRRAFIEGNTISNVIGVGITGYPTYECYGTANYYSCKDNVFINICQLPKNGILASTMPEIFKCKGGGGHKEAINNVWKIDFDECREIAASKGITFTDEVFETLNVIALLRLTSLTDSVYFAKNTITIKGGKLLGNTSSINIKNIVIDGNTFNLDSYVNNSGMFPNWNGNAEFITITNNRVIVNDDSDFTFCGTPAIREYRSNAVVVVSNNVVNRPVAIPALNARMTVLNNIQKMVNNSQIGFNIRGAEEPSVIESYINYNSSRELKLTSSIREFKNVDYNYTIHNASKSHYLGVLVLSGVSADLIFECGDNAEFRAKNTDDEISVTDKYGNTLATSSNTSYTDLFENSQLRISVKYSSTQGFFFYITYKVDDLTYKLNIASTDMNKISYPTLNRYTKGAYKFDNTANKPVWWNGSAWVDATGVTV